MRKYNGNYIPIAKHYRNAVIDYNTSPKIIIFDISIIDFHFDINNYFYSKYSPRDIIETVASIPVYLDYDDHIVHQMETRFSLDELDQLDLSMTDLLVSNVVTWFYEYFNSYLPDNIDSYLFDRWLDPRHNEIVMKRHDLY